MANETDREPFEHWCVVELFGHQRIVGLVSEVQLAGSAFLRVDVPAVGSEIPAHTKLYGPSAIYAMSLIGEAEGRALVAAQRHRPVSEYEIPELRRLADQQRLAFEDSGPEEEGPY